MALLYPWATKEYLLWEMTIGQLIMYHNAGIEIKYPESSGSKGARGMADMTPEERRAAREEAKRMMSNSREAEEAAASEAEKAKFRDKYGAI